MKSYNDFKNILLDECNKALSSVDENVTNEFIERILNANKVFIIGVGRVLLSAKCFAKRLAHLGINVHIVGEITEPAISKGDVLIACSGSGESIFPREISKKAKSLGADVIMIGSNQEGTIAKLCDLLVRVPTNTKLKCEDEIISEQIMTSLFEQFLFLYGDIVCSMIADKKQINVADLWEYHANLE